LTFLRFNFLIRWNSKQK